MKSIGKISLGPIVGLACGALLLMGAEQATAQNEIIVSQYVHNQYAINPAFAGSREGLSLYGGFRKQWTAIENTPRSFLFTGHTPLRNEKMTLGANLYVQGIHETTSAGLMVSVGYRTQIKRDVYLGFALQPGVAIRTADWSKVRLMDEQDNVFTDKESGAAPLLGFGASIYAPKYFAGLSVQTLFLSDSFERTKAEFAPADATYLLTGGYWFDVNDRWAIQPSLMLDYNKANDMATDITASVIYNEKLWVDLAYRTTKDMTIGVAYMPKRQLKIAYSYTLSMGDLRSYDAGSHEISIQYDFVYRVKTVGHRFY